MNEYMSNYKKHNHNGDTIYYEELRGT